MSIYSTRQLKGNSIFTKDRRPVAKDKVPANIRDLINAGQESVDDSTLDKLISPEKACVFCGVASKATRYLNLQTVYLCDEHYHAKTIGQVAQQLREVSNEKEEKTTQEA